MASCRRIILQNRQRSSSTKNVIGVSSKPYLNLISNPFNKRQWNYLSLDHLLDYLIIRVMDKGNNFYIDSVGEFEQKTGKFFSDTNAFIELSYSPFNEILNKVIQLLNTLRGKDLIRKSQYEQMMPDRTKCELAHLYFNPKTHKAYFSSFYSFLYYIFLRQINILRMNGKKIVEEQTKTNKFYGRFEAELRKLLDDANTWHRNIKLDYKIGNSLPFLDVQLTNNNGILSTSVYHKPAAQPYVSSLTLLAHIDNDEVADETKQPNESATKLDTKFANYEEKLFLRYTHEKRFKVFKRDMHCVYEHIFKSTPAMYTKLIVGNRNRRQATNELIRKSTTQ
ncbi:unnamed protein product [Rotaria socialis]|uniref:Uncharacterized protein n=1 Tax=Rotaria socialis TaxID=392032 RepID=A0A821UHB9_9BILA|nr:unnamed protein product [Rotaria socialis]